MQEYLQLVLVYAFYFLPLMLVAVLAGCFCTASDFRADLAPSPTAFRPSFDSTALLPAGFPRFLVGDVGVGGFADPFAGDGEMV